jgi:sulfur-carrier protein
MLPTHLWRLANASREVRIEVTGNPSLSSVLAELETRYPMLRGTIRDQVTYERRPFIRFFADGEDLSLQPADAPLPEVVTSGKEPLWIVGAMAGGKE